MFAPALTILLSSFLLFLVQPILAKQILPWFGGSAGVWTICLVFFQMVLLLGYTYAQWLARGRGSSRPFLLYILPVLLKFVTLPVLPGPFLQRAYDTRPAFAVFWVFGST